jgi:CheY-like chemotaxis protein
VVGVERDQHAGFAPDLVSEGRQRSRPELAMTDGGAGHVSGAAGGQLDDAVGLGLGEAAQRGVQRLRGGDVDRREGVAARRRGVEHLGVLLGVGNAHTRSVAQRRVAWCGVSPIGESAALAHTRFMESTVLIVDDDPQFRRAAAELLGARGYRVVGEAGNAAEGLALASALRPDAVLLDVNLPDGDGLSVAAQVSADGGPRVLLTSTDSGAATARLVRGSGAVGFVAKTELTGAALDGYLKG